MDPHDHMDNPPKDEKLPSDFIFTCPRCGAKSEDLHYEGAIAESGTFRPDGRIPVCRGDWAWKEGQGWSYLTFRCLSCKAVILQATQGDEPHHEGDEAIDRIEAAALAMFKDTAKKVCPPPA